MNDILNIIPLVPLLVIPVIMHRLGFNFYNQIKVIQFGTHWYVRRKRFLQLSDFLGLDEETWWHSPEYVIKWCGFASKEEAEKAYDAFLRKQEVIKEINKRLQAR